MSIQERLDALAGNCEYDREGEADSSVDALIDYKDGVEALVCELEGVLSQVGHVLPKGEEWNGAPGRLEDIAEILDRDGFDLRPNTSEYESH